MATWNPGEFRKAQELGAQAQSILSRDMGLVPVTVKEYLAGTAGRWDETFLWIGALRRFTPVDYVMADATVHCPKENGGFGQTFVVGLDELLFVRDLPTDAPVLPGHPVPEGR